jgi:hypothetical protein
MYDSYSSKSGDQQQQEEEEEEGRKGGREEEYSNNCERANRDQVKIRLRDRRKEGGRRSQNVKEEGRYGPTPQGCVALSITSSTVD